MNNENRAQIFNAFNEGFRDYLKYSGFEAEYQKGSDHLLCSTSGRLKLESLKEKPETFLKAAGGQESSEGFIFKVQGIEFLVVPQDGDEPFFVIDGMMTLWDSQKVTDSSAEREGQKMADALTGLVDKLVFYAKRRGAN